MTPSISPFISLRCVQPLMLSFSSSGSVSSMKCWFSAIITSPPNPGMPSTMSIKPFMAARLVLPWFHHCALGFNTTMSFFPMNFSIPPIMSITFETFCCGVPSLET